MGGGGAMLRLSPTFTSVFERTGVVSETRAIAVAISDFRIQGTGDLLRAGTSKLLPM
jgi:hypothetical protein